MEILLIFLIWYIAGITGFIFWWTKEYNLTTNDLFICFWAGTLGIFSWFIGWRIHGEPINFPKDKIIFKKRK